MFVKTAPYARWFHWFQYIAYSVKQKEERRRLVVLSVTAKSGSHLTRRYRPSNFLGFYLFLFLFASY